jgi:hypothetical protein
MIYACTRLVFRDESGKLHSFPVDLVRAYNTPGYGPVRVHCIGDPKDTFIEVHAQDRQSVLDDLGMALYMKETYSGRKADSKTRPDAGGAAGERAAGTDRAEQ